MPYWGSVSWCYITCTLWHNTTNSLPPVYFLVLPVWRTDLRYQKCWTCILSTRNPGALESCATAAVELFCCGRASTTHSAGWPAAGLASPLSPPVLQADGPLKELSVIQSLLKDGHFPLYSPWCPPASPPLYSWLSHSLTSFICIHPIFSDSQIRSLDLKSLSTVEMLLISFKMSCKLNRLIK